MECEDLTSMSEHLLMRFNHGELPYGRDHLLQADRRRPYGGHGSPCKESWSHIRTQFWQEKTTQRHWHFTEDSSDFVKETSALPGPRLPLFLITSLLSALVVPWGPHHEHGTSWCSQRLISLVSPCWDVKRYQTTEAFLKVPYSHHSAEGNHHSDIYHHSSILPGLKFPVLFGKTNTIL